MKNGKIRILALLTALLLGTCAAAETLSIDGTVTADKTTLVTAPIGGTIDEVLATVGETVTADTALVTLKTTKVYATESGTVTGVFGEAGDAVSTITNRYGAVMYIEGTALYTVSGSTTNAYNSTETKMVHIGETVYMVCRTSNKRTGTGVITAISGTDYTVEVTSGSFIPGDSVNIYRGDSAVASLLLGRGDVSRKSPTAVTGEGSIVSYNVSNGDTVTRGDVLFETLTGTFDGMWMSGNTITAGVSGTIATLQAEEGNAIQKDQTIAVIYDENSMRVEAKLPEDELQLLQVGDTVTITADSNENVTATGTVRMISAIANTSESETTYTVIIDFTPDENFRYGMDVVVSVD